MRNLTTLVVLAIPTFLANTGVCTADMITSGDGWHYFSWTGGPGVFNDQGAFTYSSPVATVLTVTDVYVDGDRFQVFNNNLSLGLTSVPLNDGSLLTGDPGQAVLDSRLSHGTFLLPPGSNSITIETVQTASGYPSGGGFLRVDPVASAVPMPEPGTLTLAVLGLGGLIWQGCRKRTRQTESDADEEQGGKVL